MCIRDRHHHVGKYGHTDVEPYSASSTKGKAGLVTQQSFRHKNEKPYHEPQESYVDQYNDCLLYTSRCV